MATPVQDAVQGSTLIPSLRYRDAYAAIDWLERVFGFRRQAVYGDGEVVHHAQLVHGTAGMLMLGSASKGGEFAERIIGLDATGGRETVGLYLIVEDPDAVHAKAVAAGAQIVQAPHSPEYGGRAFTCRDLEDRIWSVGSYNPWAGDTAGSQQGSNEARAIDFAYVGLLQGRDPVAVQQETPLKLQAILDTMTPAFIDTPPAAGKWSVREVLCHLADCEIAWGWRYRFTFGEDDPLLQPFEQDPWARAYGGSAFTAQTALATWKALRAWNLAFLETLTEADWVRPARHPEGDRNLRNLAEIAAGHDLHHLAALAKMAQTA